MDWTLSGNILVRDGIGTITIYHPDSMETVMFKKLYKPGGILKVGL